MSYQAIPAAPGAKLLGHAHLFRGDARLPFLEKLPRHGDLVRARFGYQWVYILNTPELAHELLVEQAKKVEKSPGIRMLLHDFAGQGLFTSEGELWRKQRRLLSPLFQPEKLASYVTAMNEEARLTRERLKDGDRIDLAHEMTRITMSVVARTLFGSQTEEAADEIGQALTVALGWVSDRMATPNMTAQLLLISALEALKGKLPDALESHRAEARTMLDAPVLLPGRHEPKLVAALATLDRHIQEMIRERREHPVDRNDLLTRLLLAKDGELGGATMSDKQVRDEANTLFIAGHETTATALAWAFYLLAQNPEAKAKVQAEADAFGPEGPSAFDAQKLAYTTRVFKEALRLYPPVIVIPRRSLQPITLGGQTFPPGTLMFVNVFGMHRNPDVWPDPLRFDPDRFEPSAEAARHRSAWIPFGVGPRICIGNFFALMEGPIVLATLMRTLRFDIEPGTIEPETFATLRPKGGVMARVRRLAV